PAGQIPWRRSLRLEGLADAEVHAPRSFLRTAVDDKAVDGVELLTEIDANRSDPRVVAKSRADRPTQARGLELRRAVPHVSAVDKDHAGEGSADWESPL